MSTIDWDAREKRHEQARQNRNASLEERDAKIIRLEADKRRLAVALLWSQQRIQAAEEKAQELARLANTDELTGLSNRRALKSTFEELQAPKKRIRKGEAGQTNANESRHSL